MTVDFQLLSTPRDIPMQVWESHRRYFLNLCAVIHCTLERGLEESIDRN